MYQKFFLFAVVCSLFISGCRSVPKASHELDVQAKKFQTNPNGAQIYIYRNEIFGGMIKIDVEFDGKLIGRTLPNTYFLLQVPPGNHTILSESENKSTLEIKAEKGHNYYVWQEVKMGVMLARNKLQLMDEQKGQEGVNDCELLKIESEHK